MNKKTNTAIFMVLATLLNLALLCVFFIIGFVLVGLFLNANPDSSMASVLILLVFLVSIILSFFIYSKVVKWINNRYNLEDKLDPIFGKKNRNVKRKREEE